MWLVELKEFNQSILHNPDLRHGLEFDYINQLS